MSTTSGSPKKIFTIPILFALVLVLPSCSEEKKAESKSDTFCITDNMMKVIKVDTATLESSETEINLTGKVTFDEGKVIKVFPLAGGIINDVKAELGDYVQKGQILASMHSSDIATLEKDLDVANSNLSIAEKNLDVASELYKNGYSTEKEYITAQKEYQKSKSEIVRLKEVLELFGQSNKKGSYLIKAPISGFIVEKNINTDMQIREDYSDRLFTISDLDKVWVMANVYESDISKIKPGYDVQVTTISYPDRIFRGKIDKVFNVLDPVERVMKVRVKLDNHDYTLKPEMYANITVKYQEDGKKYVRIPSNAVIFDNNKNYVMIYTDKCHVETREVTIHKAGKHFTFLEEGIRPGERLISKSQLYIYDALND